VSSLAEPAQRQKPGLLDIDRGGAGADLSVFAAENHPHSAGTGVFRCFRRARKPDTHHDLGFV